MIRRPVLPSLKLMRVCALLRYNSDFAAAGLRPFAQVPRWPLGTSQTRVMLCDIAKIISRGEIG